MKTKKWAISACECELKSIAGFIMKNKWAHSDGSCLCKSANELSNFEQDIFVLRNLSGVDLSEFGT